MELTQTQQDFIREARPDIDVIDFDQAAEGFNPYGNLWAVYEIPVEAIFRVDEDGCDPADAGVNHGTLTVVINSEGEVWDYSVGDWTHGRHPDLHTFER